MTPLLLPAPPVRPLLCAFNPIYASHLPGQWVNTRNGRRGLVVGHYLFEAKVRVEIDIDWKWGWYPETYTIDELAKYNPQWRTAARPPALAKVAA